MGTAPVSNGRSTTTMPFRSSSRPSELGITFWDTANSGLNPLSLGCWPKISPEADNQHPKPLPEPDEASQTLGKQPAHP
jgi:hypothetical protein